MSLPPEIWSMIAEKINDPRAWKSFLQTCTMFSCFASDEKTLALSNPLWTLIEKHPDRDWNWQAISSNNLTTFAIVERNLDKPWDWQILVQLLVFPEDFLFDAIEILRNFSIKDEYDYAINLMYIKVVEHMDLLVRNKNLPGNFLIEYQRIFDPCKIIELQSWETIQKLSIIPCEHICFNQSIPFETLDKLEIFNFEFLSYNPKLPLWFFEKHLYQDWDFHLLSHNSAVTVDFITIAPDEDWDWNMLSGAEHAVEIFEKFPDKPWNYNYLSYQKGLTLDLVLRHPSKPWCIEALSTCLALTINDVRAHPELHWDYTALLQNENIPLEDLLREFTLLDNGLIIHNSLQNSGMHHHLAMLSFEQAVDIDSTELYSTQDLLSYRDHPMRDVLAHPEINWDYEAMSCSSGLSWLYVDQYPELFDFNNISCNQFTKFRK